MAASILNPYVKRSVKVKSLNDITTKERFSPLTANLMSKSRVFPHLGFPDAVPAAELAANGDYPQIPACLVLLWHQQPPRCWCQAVCTGWPRSRPQRTLGKEFQLYRQWCAPRRKARGPAKDRTLTPLVDLQVPPQASGSIWGCVATHGTVA